MKVVKLVLAPSGINVQEKQEIVDTMIQNFTKLNCPFSPKMHYIFSHLEILTNNQFLVSDEHGERMHQTFKQIEDRYAAKGEINMLAEFVWNTCF